MGEWLNGRMSWVLDLTDAISRIQLLHSDDVKSFFLQRSHESPGLLTCMQHYSD